MVKCDNCNLIYNEGEFCVKCGKKLVYCDEASQANENLTHITFVDSSLENADDLLEITEPHFDEDDVTSPSNNALDEGDVASPSNNALDEQIYKLQTDEELISNPTMVLSESEALAENESDNSNIKSGYDNVISFVRKWYKKALALTAIVVVLIFGLLVYDFNTSQIYDVVERNIGDDGLLEDLIQRGINEDEFDIVLSESDVNGLIYKYLNYQALTNSLGNNIEELYYDASRQAFIANVNAPFAKTSLIFNIDSSQLNNSNRLLINNLRVGSKEHTYPLFIIKLFTGLNGNEILLSNNIFIIEDFAQKGDVSLKGHIKNEYVADLVEQIRDSNHSQFISFLARLGADQSDNTIINAYYNYEPAQIKQILLSLLSSDTMRAHWLSLMNEVTLQKVLDDVNLSSALFNKFDVAAVLTDYTARRTKYLTDYQSYINNDAVKNLKSDVEKIYEIIEEVHFKSGVPVKIISSNGKVYSRTLNTYFYATDLSMVGMFYDLYALNDKIAIGIENKDGFFYICVGADGVASEIAKEKSADDFKKKIGYQKDEEHDSFTLTEADHEREAIINLVKSDYNLQELYIRFIASDGKDAFLVSSNSNDTQIIEQILLQKNSNGEWQIIKKFNSEPLTLALKTEIENHSFNTRILPPFDVSDFEIQPYSATEIAEVMQHLVVKGVVNNSSFVTFFSRIGDNLFLEMNDGKRVLLVFKENSRSSYNKIIELDNALPIENYYPELNNLTGFPNYFPKHLFID